MKVLGITRRQTNDKLPFDLLCIFDNAAKEQVTKRSILSSITRFYEPLRLLSPVIMPFKQLIHEVCKLKVNRDAQVSQEISHKWHELTNDISQKPLVHINRCI